MSSCSASSPATARPARSPDGCTVCDLRIAVNGQKDHPPRYIDIATFGKQADACAAHLTKSRQIAVSGQLVYRPGGRRFKSCLPD
jgi:hypothetical protein